MEEPPPTFAMIGTARSVVEPRRLRRILAMSPHERTLRRRLERRRRRSAALAAAAPGCAKNGRV